MSTNIVEKVDKKRGVKMVEVVDRLTRIAHSKPGASLRLPDVYNDEYELLTGRFQREHTDVQSKFTKWTTFTYKYWLSEKLLNRSVRKTPRSLHITSDRSRCSSC